MVGSRAHSCRHVFNHLILQNLNGRLPFLGDFSAGSTHHLRCCMCAPLRVGLGWQEVVQLGPPCILQTELDAEYSVWSAALRKYLLKPFTYCNLQICRRVEIKICA